LLDRDSGVAPLFSHVTQSAMTKFGIAKARQGNSKMAMRGIGFFDTKGQYFKSPEDATLSDLSAVLGRVGEGESLAPGIAKTLFEKRREIERIFTDHDDMVRALAYPGISVADKAEQTPKLVGNISPIRTAS
jgi:hypothetical protein